MHSCLVCGAPGRLCCDSPVLGLTAYCGRACQKGDWSQHKLNCLARRDRRSVVGRLRELAETQTRVVKPDTLCKESLAAAVEEQTRRLLEYAAKEHFSRGPWCELSSPESLVLRHSTHPERELKYRWLERETRLTATGVLAAADLPAGSWLVTERRPVSLAFGNTSFARLYKTVLYCVLAGQQLQPVLDIPVLAVLSIVCTTPDAAGIRQLTAQVSAQELKQLTELQHFVALVVFEAAANPNWSLAVVEAVCAMVGRDSVSVPLPAPWEFLMLLHTLDWDNQLASLEDGALSHEAMPMAPRSRHHDRPHMEDCPRISFAALRGRLFLDDQLKLPVLHAHLGRMQTDPEPNVSFYNWLDFGGRVTVRTLRHVRQGEQLLQAL